MFQSQAMFSAPPKMAPEERQSASSLSTSMQSDDKKDTISVAYSSCIHPQSLLKNHINPAIHMTEEERLAKYNEMKANDKFELVDGYFAKIHKVLPNLITFDYEQDVKNNAGFYDINLGTLRFTTLNGDVFTIEWDEIYGTYPEDRHEKLKNLYSGKGWSDTPIDPKSDIWDMKYCFLGSGVYDPKTFTCANGDEIIVGVSDSKIRPYEIKIADSTQPGDYITYTIYDSEERFLPTGICKTLEDCTIEILAKGYYGTEDEYRIFYPNGDVYIGSLNLKAVYRWENPYDGWGGIEDISFGMGGVHQKYTAATKWIESNKKLSDIGSIKNGMITSKDNSVKIYVNGEYDEIESIAHTQRIQAEEREKKKAAEAVVKQRAALTQKYGKKYVDIFYRPEFKINEIIITGMPVELLMEFNNAGKLAINIEIDMSIDGGRCYEIFGYTFGGKKVKLGYFWEMDGRITSFCLYDM